ncbi:MAG: DDE-type integrase/transposase/recombinase, partial [Candidatus Thiodiazotropha taylori]|nr:DDE-type integrase/transposase/recombinase [Candidatus Thiodiazotropha taylori]MCW4309946.1 reverse transcriptase domain-containing protein [Candidatus Thiodiazotropha endolucinida]
MNDCLVSNHDLFVTEENPSLGLTSVVEHQIHLIPNAKSKHQRPYRLSPDKREVLRHQLDELLQQGIITPVSEKEDIPISSPIVLVSKRNKPKPGVEPGSREASLSMYRFCVDFRYLNSQTQDFRYAIPDVQELTESFSQRTPNYISSIDLSSGFFQMKISSGASKYTAFNTCFGTYKFQRLPQGLKTSPNSFQMLMDKILSGLSFRSTLCYLDDVLIFSETFNQHLSDLQEVFDRFRAAGLKLSPEKCRFAQSHCIFLGHQISRQGVSPPSDRLKAVSEYPVPKNTKQLKRYLGLMNWFKKYIPGYSAKAHCLYQLLRKGAKFIWTEAHKVAFESLKASLLNSEALAFPRYDLPFYLGVDTSSKGIGYMLYQKHSTDSGDESVRVVRFGSKSLSHYQTSYGPTKLELLGVVTSILDCASYLRGRKFFVECDHQALKPLFQKSLKGAIYERWLAILQEFNFEISYKPAESMVVCDSLSRAKPVHSLDSAESSPNENDPYFPYVPEPANKIFFPNGSTLQDIISTEQSNQQKSVNNVLIPPTSLHMQLDNDSAYEGDTDLPQVKCSDTKRKYVARGKTQGKFHRVSGKVKSPRLATKPQSPENSQISDNEQNKQFSPGNSQNTYYTQGDTTDVEGNSASLSSVQPNTRSDTQTNNHENQSIDSDQATSSLSESQASANEIRDNNRSIENVDLFKSFDFSPDKISALQREDCDLRYLIQYLENKELPKSQKRARKLLLQSADYCLIDGLLFHCRVPKSQRTSQIGQYQLVVPEIMIKTVLGLYHDSPMGGHSGIQDTLDRVKEHYFFPRMSQLVTDYVRSCPDCQKRKQTKVRTKSGITAYTTPSGPFQVWQIDLYGNLPITPQGYTYVLTATDLFSKYLVTIPLANKDTLSVASGLTQLFTKYGVCDTLLSDRGVENVSKVMAEVCRQLCIPQEFSPAFVHKCLGAVERAHRTMAERLTPYMNSRLNNWIDILPCITFSINQSVHSGSKYSPHEIIYGQRPKFPLSPPTPPDFDTIPLDMRTYVRKHADKLSIIRSEVKNNILSSQQKMLERANKNSDPLPIKEGDYVFLLTERTGVGQKIQNKFTGPFVIHRCISPHMVLLRNPDNGTVHKSEVHIDRLKMAYVREPDPTPYFLSKVVTAETVRPEKVTEAMPDT